MKPYTDISQSKKLAEILPIESADMHYSNVSIRGINYVDEYRAELMEYNRAIKVLSKYTINPLFEIIPCWSLAALLNVLPDEITDDDGDVYRNMFFHLKGKYIVQYPRLATLWPSLLSVEVVNLVDACVEMILKLHELKKL